MVLATIIMLIELFLIMFLWKINDELEEIILQERQMAEANKKHYKNKIEQLESRIIQMNEKELPSWELDNL